MTQRSSLVTGRGGFTLAEMLVAMALLAILAAILVPSVLSQIGKGEAARVANDLKTISETAKVVYSDASRWPGSLKHLVTTPLSGEDASPVDWDAEAIKRWAGPYLDKADYIGADALQTGGGGSISTTLDSTTDANYITATVTGLSDDNKKRVDIMLDGVAGPTEGNVTFTLGASNPLKYKLARIK